MSRAVIWEGPTSAQSHKRGRRDDGRRRESGGVKRKRETLRRGRRPGVDADEAQVKGRWPFTVGDSGPASSRAATTIACGGAWRTTEDDDEKSNKKIYVAWVLTNDSGPGITLVLFDYIRALQEERKKIEVFQRELPLCMQLVNQAIESVSGQKATRNNFIDGRVLKEFIPLKPSSKERLVAGGEAEKSVSIDGKPDWLRSAQLWIQEADTGAAEANRPCPVEPIVGKAKKLGEANRTLEGEKHNGLALTDANMSEDKEKEGQPQPCCRKTRRCWTPELHRRFLHALEQLGGINGATPKKIKEFMEEDGLTSDEIKSHLQKYRLHNRQRLSPAIQSTSNNGHPAPQFVVVGDIWVPPQPNGLSFASPVRVYSIAPPAALVPDRPPLRMHSVDGCSSAENNSSKNNDGDPANSCSSQTTTASPHSLNYYN